MEGEGSLSLGGSLSRVVQNLEPQGDSVKTCIEELVGTPACHCSLNESKPRVFQLE